MIEVRKLDPRNYNDWAKMGMVVVRAAPPTVEVTPLVLDNIRAALMSGEMSAWMFSNGTPLGVAITTIRNDNILGCKEMLIYAAAGLRDISKDEWLGCFEKMRSHSKSLGCTHISFYTQVERLVRVAAAMGADPLLRYVQIPLEAK